MKEPEDYPHGYLLRTVAYHCGIRLKLTDKLRLFVTQSLFEVDDIIDFTVRSRVFEYPSMSVHKLTNLAGIEEL
jgi:hypothetical protein